MKLTDFLQDVGRPIAYYPGLRRITGSVTATILLCQFIYWRGKESDPNGWLYKTSDDIQQETGLSYGEQKTARRDLVEAGLIEEHYARLDHQMKFRVNLEIVNDKWGIEESVTPESGKPQLGNEQKPLSLNESETTTENTTQTTAKAAGDIFKAYQANIGLLTPIMSDTIGETIDTYPSDWIVESITLAAQNNARNWKYCEAILKRWQTKGKDNGSRIKQPERQEGVSSGYYG